MGIRNGKKTTTKNIARIGKHSELLKITDDPLAYAKEQVILYNEEVKKQNKVSFDIKIDFAQKIKATSNVVSDSNTLNIGYFFLQKMYQQFDLASFFEKVTEAMKIEFEPDLVNRFLTYARILHPQSKLATHSHLNHYYEKPDLNYVHILRTMDIARTLRRVYYPSLRKKFLFGKERYECVFL